MNQKEIMEALLSGKKIRAKEWCKSEYVYLKGNNIIDENGEVFSVDFGVSYNYEIYEEPKKQVEKFLWNVRFNHSKVWQLSAYYLTEKEMEEYYKVENYELEYHKTNFSILVDED